ncbi:hypothetical protein AVEN_188294-1 [Araneus ventricosus]|uniref:DUF19 domain-containing protein n=1 Tax=Araneus ventricosus TaxID=182803 RepID=A0A4Y2JHR7_ARAVE|nr:hypothetical protein AVEN_188294-1 [Araneus ventricosus]
MKTKIVTRELVNDTKCVEPINEVMSGFKTTADIIKANKKVCNFSKRIRPENYSDIMKFLILFAVAALFGSVHCDDQECFRDVFKECVKQTPPGKQMELCDEVKFQIDCVARFSVKCDMDFKEQAEAVKEAAQRVCGGGDTQKLFDAEKACYKKAIDDTKCVGPIRKAMEDKKNAEEIIKANKKVCGLFESFSKCAKQNAQKDCGSTSDILFDSLYDPLYNLADSICKELILPANEKEDRPDSYGVLNPYMVIYSFFGYV